MFVTNSEDTPGKWDRSFLKNNLSKEQENHRLPHMGYYAAEPGASRGVVLKKRAVRFFRGARRQDSLSRQTKSPASTAFHAVVLRTTAPGVPLYGYRHLSTELGRWVSRDPMGERGGWNVYEAMRNAAIVFVDANGRDSSYWPSGNNDFPGVISPDPNPLPSNPEPAPPDPTRPKPPSFDPPTGNDPPDRAISPAPWYPWLPTPPNAEPYEPPSFVNPPWQPPSPPPSPPPSSDTCPLPCPDGNPPPSFTVCVTTCAYACLNDGVDTPVGSACLTACDWCSNYGLPAACTACAGCIAGGLASVYPCYASCTGGCIGDPCHTY